jgi:hypothetical protein
LFNRGDLGWYWSSTEYDYQSTFGFCALHVDMGDGNTDFDLKFNPSSVRAVSTF